MALLKGGKLRSLGGADGQLCGYCFWCPGCDGPHVVMTTGKVTWSFNGDVERPTFSPSLLLHEHGAPDTEHWQPRCHSFIRDGHIQFLGDCTHALKGQTVPIPSWPEDHMQWSDGYDGTGA